MIDTSIEQKAIKCKQPDHIQSLWLEQGKDIIKGALTKQEEAARQLITITTLLQGIYFAAISFSDLKKALMVQQHHGVILAALIMLFAIPIIFWLISLSFSMRVIVPVTRLTNLYSPDLISATFYEAVDYKQRNLYYAQWSLILGLIPLAINIYIYLALMQIPLSSGT
jgi:hypothetical protein